MVQPEAQGGSTCQDIVQTIEPAPATIVLQINDLALLIGEEISRLHARIDDLNKD